MYLLGQLCGIVGTIITIVQPQLRRKEQILFCSLLTNSMSALNYGLIGQTGSAVFLCLIAIVQSMVGIWHERKETEVSKVESVLFFCLYIGFGIFGMISTEGFVWEISWKNALELLPIVGALMLMLSVFAKGEQKTRVFLLLNGASWMAYTAIIGATMFFACAAAMLSSVNALWKYRKADIPTENKPRINKNC